MIFNKSISESMVLEEWICQELMLDTVRNQDHLLYIYISLVQEALVASDSQTCLVENGDLPLPSCPTLEPSLPPAKSTSGIPSYP